MANSLVRHWLWGLALVSSALGAQNATRTCNELLFDGKSFEVDGKTNLIKLLAPRITQCGMSIAADEALATSVDVQAKSEWTFSGHVRITLDSAVVTSDSAVFTFDDKELGRAELAGQATFEDASEGKTPVRGGADKVVYDYTTRTLRLTERAWVNKGQVEANGCDFVYNLTTRNFGSGSSDCGDEFKIRYSPKKSDDAAGADPPR
jgi:lipopolysaccharide transport protein LptA